MRNLATEWPNDTEHLNISVSYSQGCASAYKRYESSGVDTSLRTCCKEVIWVPTNMYILELNDISGGTSFHISCYLHICAFTFN